MPGPQSPLYAAGAVMEQTYPVPPLLPGHALAIGVTSYDGTCSTASPPTATWCPTPTLFGACLSEALDELLDTVGDAPPAGAARAASGVPGSRAQAVTRLYLPATLHRSPSSTQGGELHVGDDVVVAAGRLRGRRSTTR